MSEEGGRYGHPPLDAERERLADELDNAVNAIRAQAETNYLRDFVHPIQQAAAILRASSGAEKGERIYVADGLRDEVTEELDRAMEKKFGKAVYKGYMMPWAAQPQADAAGWRPIESAPKDGTRILVWQVWPGPHLEWIDQKAQERVVIVFWSDRKWIGNLTGDASHWRPLPSTPPASSPPSPSDSGEQT